MSTIVFFRQARVDRGIHTGIDVNGTGWEYYDAGSDQHDPDSPEDARQWLLENELLVTATYRQLAERLEVGMDPDVWPLQVENPQPPAGVSLAAVCCCTRRVSARQMNKTV
jgi:hypothetical protein